MAVANAGVAIAVASRSDSTLRGHFPMETDPLHEELGPYDLMLFAPYFEAGGRLTIGDTHFVVEGDRLVPAVETPFARDPVFGFRNSNLRSWMKRRPPAALERRTSRACRSISSARSGRTAWRKHCWRCPEARMSW
jgi:uncharacterized protein YgbK (DUF1537 family)